MRKPRYRNPDYCIYQTTNHSIIDEWIQLTHDLYTTDVEESNPDPEQECQQLVSEIVAYIDFLVTMGSTEEQIMQDREINRLCEIAQRKNYSLFLKCLLSELESMSGEELTNDTNNTEVYKSKNLPISSINHHESCLMTSYFYNGRSKENITYLSNLFNSNDSTHININQRRMHSCEEPFLKQMIGEIMLHAH